MRKVLAIAGLLALLAIPFMVVGANGVCPEGGDWSPHQDPPLSEVQGAVEYCVKGGHVDTSSACVAYLEQGSFEYVSGIVNQPDACGLSHWSYRLGDDPTETPTEVPPTETPTEVPPTETPTEVPPTETPTEVTPTDTPDPEVTPTPTEVPPTETPTEVTPTETPTDVPPTPTDVPGDCNTEGDKICPPETGGSGPLVGETELLVTLAIAGLASVSAGAYLLWQRKRAV